MGRNDHNINFRDLLLEPDHSQAITMGFQKSLGNGAHRSRLRGEWANLSRSQTFQVRATPPYYVHHLVTQGYTQRGQIIGAAIGPGSDSQQLGFDHYTTGGRWGFFVQRVRYDDDAYYTLFKSETTDGHQVEITGGMSVFRFVRGLQVGGLLAVSQQLNRHYVVNNDVTNLNLQLTIRRGY